MDLNEYIIEMLNITKEFPGIIANDNITLQLKKGEIHALLGENGAGKSTLMSVLFGLYQPEKGEIRKNGETVRIKDPNDANALGIGILKDRAVTAFDISYDMEILPGCEISTELTVKDGRFAFLGFSEDGKRRFGVSGTLTPDA